GRLLLQRLRASRRGAPGDPRARGSVPHRAGEADDRGPGPGDGGSDPSRPASVASRGSQLAFRSMRVGLVCPYDLSAPGGVQQLVLELAERLRGVGHEAVVVGAGNRDGPVPEGSVAVGRTWRFEANDSTALISLDPAVWGDRKSVVEGKGGEVGGRGLLDRQTMRMIDVQRGR